MCQSMMSLLLLMMMLMMMMMMMMMMMTICVLQRAVPSWQPLSAAAAAAVCRAPWKSRTPLPTAARTETAPCPLWTRETIRRTRTAWTRDAPAAGDSNSPRGFSRYDALVTGMAQSPRQIVILLAMTLTNAGDGPNS